MTERPKAFPYRECTWHVSDEQSQQWLAVLEKTGAANVRARLAQTDAASAGAIAIGTAPVMTIGFAQEWLNWKDNQNSRRISNGTSGRSGGLGPRQSPHRSPP